MTSPHRPALDEPMAVDFAATLPAAPVTYSACTECGAEFTGTGKCWDCREKAHRAAKLLAEFAAGVPERFRWARFGHPQLPLQVAKDKNDKPTSRGPELVKLAEAAVDCRRVTLVGDSGVGKTILVVAMAREWVRRNRAPAHFCMASVLGSSRLRHAEREVIEAVDAPLLILDNLGQDATMASSPIVEVIEQRNAKSRPLWITTWLGRHDALAARYDDGTARRVLEAVRIIECTREAKP